MTSSHFEKEPVLSLPKEGLRGIFPRHSRPARESSSLPLPLWERLGEGDSKLYEFVAMDFKPTVILREQSDRENPSLPARGELVEPLVVSQ